MTKIQNTKNNEKMAEYCKTCVCKSCEQVAELKAENERLKARVKEIGEKMSFLNADRCSEIMKYKQTLQKIKDVAETAINGGYATKSSDYSEGMEIIGHYVLQKITKAKEE